MIVALMAASTLSGIALVALRIRRDLRHLGRMDCWPETALTVIAIVSLILLYGEGRGGVGERFAPWFDASTTICALSIAYLCVRAVIDEACRSRRHGEDMPRPERVQPKRDGSHRQRRRENQRRQDTAKRNKARQGRKRT